MLGASSWLARTRAGKVDAALPERMRGRTVLVTGASSGIGAATARRLARAGARVALVARASGSLPVVEAEIRQAGGQCRAFAADLSDLDQCAEVGDRVLAEWNSVDVLVNCAGHSIRRTLEDSWERVHDFERTMRINYLAPVQLILRLAPHMIDAGKGHIVNVSSMGVQIGAPDFSAYCASKSALDTFSRCVAMELEARGNIAVTTIHMGLVRTPMIRPSASFRLYPALSPEAAADIVCESLIKRPRRVSPAVGRAFEVAYALSPALVERAYRRGLRSVDYRRDAS